MPTIHEVSNLRAPAQAPAPIHKKKEEKSSNPAGNPAAYEVAYYLVMEAVQRESHEERSVTNSEAITNLKQTETSIKNNEAEFTSALKQEESKIGNFLDNAAKTVGNFFEKEGVSFFDRLFAPKNVVSFFEKEGSAIGSFFKRVFPPAFRWVNNEIKTVASDLVKDFDKDIKIPVVKDFSKLSNFVEHETKQALKRAKDDWKEFELVMEKELAPAPEPQTHTALA